MVRYLTNKVGELVTFQFCLTFDSSLFRIDARYCFLINLGLESAHLRSIQFQKNIT